MSDSLRPHELQHTRLPCPSPTPGVYPNSCPLSWWCHPTISSSVVPFSSCLQSFSVSGLHMAAAAKSHQSCPTLWDPIDGSPPGSPVPGILQARTLGWFAIFFSSAWKWSHSVVSDSSRPMDCSLPGSSIHEISQARVLEWVAIAFSITHGCRCCC